MTHTLITGRPGSGLTYTAKGIAREAVGRGESVTVVAGSEYRAPEWANVEGITVTINARRAVTKARDLVYDRAERRAYDETPHTVILDDPVLGESDWDAVERITGLGRQVNVTLVITTRTLRGIPRSVADSMEVVELEPAAV